MGLFITPVMLGIFVWTSCESRVPPDIVCGDGIGFRHKDMCCLNCPAGTFVKDVCSKDLEKGVCQPCDFDTYTEHDNGLLNSCLKCTMCRSDQELVERCNSTRNTRCQCKVGTYCMPDQACEVCNTCRKCKENEEMVKSCTAHSNTVCQQRSFTSDSTLTVAVASFVSIIMMIIIIFCFVYWKASDTCKKAVVSRWPIGMWKMCMENGTDLEVRQNSMNGELERVQVHSPLVPTQPVGEDTLEDEEDKGLGPSLPHTSASSQSSLSACVLTPEYCLSHSLPQQLTTLEQERLRRVTPLNDDSLRKSFDLFEVIDVKIHNRFFRHLGLSDNDIRSTEMNFPSHDRVYELLMIWLQKEGMKADFNILIVALETLNQRMSAGNIVTKAVESGYFRYEED